jgi:septum formation protein
MAASVTEDRSVAPRLILASASPRRQQLLREAGYRFDVQPAQIDEDDYPPGLAPSEVARRLALAKAGTVGDRFPDAVVLGADTLVTFGDRILGKPAGPDEARDMLRLLSGTTHIVITGLAVVARARGFECTMRAMSAVRMRPLTAQQIEHYVASNQWQDKAGGYGIQDDDPFVTRLGGSETNVVGLPMEAAGELLGGAGIAPSAVPDGPDAPRTPDRPAR